MTATIIDDLLANRQMRNNDLTPFMFKKSDFILRLCWQSLSGQCFVTRKKSEKNDRCVVSPLIKSCADLPLVSRPSIWISARLSTQSRFFIFCYKPLNQRLVQRLFQARILREEPFHALSSRHLEPFPAQILRFPVGYPTGFFELKSGICAVFMRTTMFRKNSAILRFHFSRSRKSGLPSKMP